MAIAMIVDYSVVRQSNLDLKSLKELVRQGEGQHLEFKLKTNHPDKIIKGVVAFANSEGGVLILGVSDDRQIKGLKFVDEDEFLMVRAIERHCSPTIDYAIERIRLDDTDREILVFVVKSSLLKPHFVDLDGIPENRKSYVRVADKSVQASKEVREILKGERKGLNVKFHFGDKEKTLMQYLDIHKTITVDTFADIASINRKVASRTLVLLVLAKVLRIQANDVADFYSRI